VAGRNKLARRRRRRRRRTSGFGLSSCSHRTTYGKEFGFIGVHIGNDISQWLFWLQRKSKAS
jgi:hypothetical protein